MSVPNHFGILPRLCQGNGSQTFPHFRCLGGQHTAHKLWSGQTCFKLIMESLPYNLLEIPLDFRWGMRQMVELKQVLHT
jgi:hypothetical protein